MALQVEVRSRVNAFDLAPAEREQVFDVLGSCSIVCELLVRLAAQSVGLDAERREPVPALLPPVLEPCGLGAGRNEELHLHLLEFARAEQEVLRVELVAERLADLRDAEGRTHPRRLHHVLEVDEDALGRFGTEVDGVRGVFDGAYERLEHQVEVANLGPLP